MEKILWGQTPDGVDVYKYKIKNSNGMNATLMNYGADLLELFVQARGGDFEDVVLGFKDLESYYDNDPCFGCSVAPYANRIKNASFTLNDVTYKLEANAGNNCHHSGTKVIPFHHRIWEVTEHTENRITFHIESKDLELGFPGNLKCDVTYSIDDDNMLNIEYKAISDKDTIFNPTNHSYFNLSGFNAGSRSLLQSSLWIDADSFTLTDNNSVPTGEIASVSDTPMDFREPQALIKNVDNFDYEPIKIGKGYDHNFVINNWDGSFKKVASLYDPRSFKTMEIFTDLPGLQVYTGNYLSPNPIGKGNYAFHPRDGVAFETQYFPNAINIPSFPQPIIKANEEYYSKTGYRFSVLDF
ncbi:MAG: galactose mutarotase [Lachnospiraceae bacterium]|nr:galactose mutarotase [Lachnospiraceae bacterium]